MANVVIFLFGCLATSLCAVFLTVTIREMRKLGAEADRRGQD